MKLTKQHWEQCKQDNVNLILQSQMQIKMAKRIIILAEEEIKKFPVKKSKLKSAHRK